MVRPTYPVSTERLLLRPFTPDDLEDVLEWERRPDVHRYLYTDPRSREEVAQALARRIQMTAIDADSQAIRLAVVLR
ncbi:MAG: GNAT family N-acetyltransferase, partial [Geodermatophilaceae bacterium]|nr:GNAT family N-acetyltransferase [Geodermatophilaceae bacterium]